MRSRREKERRGERVWVSGQCRVLPLGAGRVRLEAGGARGSSAWSMDTDGLCGPSRGPLLFRGPEGRYCKGRFTVATPRLYSVRMKPHGGLRRK